MSERNHCCPRCTRQTAREVGRATDASPFMVRLECSEPDCGHSEFLRSEPAHRVAWPFGQRPEPREQVR